MNVGLLEVVDFSVPVYNIL